MGRRKNRDRELIEYEELVGSVNDSEESSLSTVSVDYKKEINKNIPNSLKIVAKNDSQAELINSIKNNLFTICYGKAGTGKTYVALTLALSMIRKQSSTYKHIYLVKSVAQLQDEDLGYLKGDLKDKFEPYMTSFYQNIEKIIPEASLRNLINSKVIKPSPIAFVRGVTIDDSIVIIDELQNITIDNLKSLMTRIGTNSKYILLGDKGQIDIKEKWKSSLKHAVKMFVNNDDIGIIEMNPVNENVRHPIIDKIVEIFEAYEPLLEEAQKEERNKRMSGI